MAVVIRLSRAGSKKRPFYRIVVADKRAPRDGRFIEKLGTLNPLLPKDSEIRLELNVERAKYWISEGALPTDRCERILAEKGIGEIKKRNNPNKGKPGKKAVERIEEQKQKAEAKVTAEAEAKEAAKAAKLAEAEAAKAAAEAPAEEVAVEEVAVEAPAEEVPVEVVPVETAAEVEAPAEEAVVAEVAEEVKADA